VTARREASSPPSLPGYEYVRVLGFGGFADVFLFHQDLPRRDVAVKVLLANRLDDEVRERFTAEANLMAQLSHHPSIVTIHHAGIAPDGRPYLVMEYCSRPGLAERYRNERVGVPEALRIGIRLASAVETAHRAGIVHRDIKPANVLTTDFGWPALTDFGIAGTIGQRSGATVGMSIPWSPPEMLADDPSGDERADVYSLAATLYSLLAGRTPFEVPGGANGAHDLVARIERAPLPPTGRPDVPAELEAVLARAMAKDPARRYATALEVARALQRVEAALRLPVTTLDLPDEPVVAPQPDSDDEGAAGATRLRPVVAIGPDAVGDATRLRPVVAVSPVAAAAGPAVPPLGVAVPPPGRFVAPPPVVPDLAGPDEDEPVGGGRTRALSAVLAALVVVAAIVGLVTVWTRGGLDRPGASQTFEAPTSVPQAISVPAADSLRGVVQTDGSVTFTWRNPDPRDGDRYQWGLVSATGEEALALVDEPTVTVPAPDGEPVGEVCIQVFVVRADRSVSTEPARGCAS